MRHALQPSFSPYHLISLEGFSSPCFQHGGLDGALGEYTLACFVFLMPNKGVFLISRVFSSLYVALVF